MNKLIIFLIAGFCLVLSAMALSENSNTDIILKSYVLTSNSGGDIELGSANSCTYSGSGNWAINASHQCNLTATNLLTNNVTIIGSSVNECCTRGLANLTNYTFLRMDNAYVYS
jgi:hypothetical protein